VVVEIELQQPAEDDVALVRMLIEQVVGKGDTACPKAGHESSSSCLAP
jgi:hypothetical protein